MLPSNIPHSGCWLYREETWSDCWCWYLLCWRNHTGCCLSYLVGCVVQYLYVQCIVFSMYSKLANQCFGEHFGISRRTVIYDEISATIQYIYTSYLWQLIPSLTICHSEWLLKFIVPLCNTWLLMIVVQALSNTFHWIQSCGLVLKFNKGVFLCETLICLTSRSSCNPEYMGSMTAVGIADMSLSG